MGFEVQLGALEDRTVTWRDPSSVGWMIYFQDGDNNVTVRSTGNQIRSAALFVTDQARVNIFGTKDVALVSLANVISVDRRTQTLIPGPGDGQNQFAHPFCAARISGLTWL